MCVWSTISYGCGHHETHTELCRIKKAARDNNAFIHSVQCQLVDAYVEQPRSCLTCQRKTLAVISYDQQQPQVLGKDPRDELPSQTRKKIPGASSKDSLQRKPLPPLPAEAKFWTTKPILTTERKCKIWQGTSVATGLECARLEALGKNAFPSISPLDGRVIDENGQLWLTAAAHEKQHCRSALQAKATRNRLRARDQFGTPREAYRAAQPGQQSSSGLRGQPFPRPESASTQQEAELFLNVKEQNKAPIPEIPACLVPGGASRISKQISFSRLSAHFDKTRNHPRDVPAQETTEPAPAQGRVAPSPPINTIGRFEVLNAQQNESKRSSLFPPRIPKSKRISSLHFEGTVLDTLTEMQL